MKYIRIIPRLDIKGSNLVKGIHLEGLRVLGKPELCDEFRSPHLWKKTNGDWKLRHTVNSDGVDD